jgi:hypothetical protein
MSTHATFIDWQQEFRSNFDNWTNHGRRVLEEKCKHYTRGQTKAVGNNDITYSGSCDKCDYSEGYKEPMMNYGYPLGHVPSDEEILKVVKNTCLTVMENTDTGVVYLALCVCGGGMDLTQSIGLAYLLAGERIPAGLALEINTQPALSVSMKEYFKVMRGIKESLKLERAWSLEQMLRASIAVREARHRADTERQSAKIKNSQNSQ